MKWFLGAWLFGVSMGVCEERLRTETLVGDGVWVDPGFATARTDSVRVVVWFEEQFLGDGEAYLRRTKEFSDIGRLELRKQMISTLKGLSKNAAAKADGALRKLEADGDLSQLRYHWIVNGFSCQIRKSKVEELKKVPGVRMIYYGGTPSRGFASGKVTKSNWKAMKVKRPKEFDIPWYIEKLKVNQVWDTYQITGSGVLNVVHDGNFVLSPPVAINIYTNPDEIENQKDDSGNGLIDDIHGYDFSRKTGNINRFPFSPDKGKQSRELHGHQCVAIMCGVETEKHPYRMGLAPDSKWAGVLASAHIEDAVEWAAEQGAATYSMSFSRPNMGELRSHWRKLMEHGAFCGIHFVSGAGNFAMKGTSKYAPVPIQMRTPEDIPNVVFAAAGVQRDLSRTPFSSQGPVKWQTHHYHEGLVDKPEVAAFNYQIPQLRPDETRVDGACNGNSFAGPMFCGTIALVLSANPNLKPWETRDIILKTAVDIGSKGYDNQTGHGLINALEAVKLALGYQTTSKK